MCGPGRAPREQVAALSRIRPLSFTLRSVLHLRLCLGAETRSAQSCYCHRAILLPTYAPKGR